jgi:hypothetical protein
MEIQLLLGLALLVVVAYFLLSNKSAAKVTDTPTPAETEPVILNAEPVVEQSVPVVETAPVKKPRKPRAAKVEVASVKATAVKSVTKKAAPKKETAKKPAARTVKSKKV